MMSGGITFSTDNRPPDGGAPARRAVIRWSWRLVRREWRQQFFIFALRMSRLMWVFGDGPTAVQAAA